LSLIGGIVYKKSFIYVNHTESLINKFKLMIKKIVNKLYFGQGNKKGGKLIL